MDRSKRRWEGRRFTDAERFRAYQRILQGRSYVEIAAELNCSLKFLYRHFGTQKDRSRRTSLRSPLRLSAAEREEISRGLKEGTSLRTIASRHAGPRQRSRARSRATAAARSTAPGALMSVPCDAWPVPETRSWRGTPGSAARSRAC